MNSFISENLAIAILLGIGVFFIAITIIAIAYKNRNKQSALNRRQETSETSTWIFDGFNDRVYRVFWGDANADDIIRKLGVKTEEYYQYCKITKTEPNTKRLAVNFIYGMAAIIVGIILTYFVSPYFLGISLIIFIILMYAEFLQKKAAANRMREEMSEGLPRFMDLIESELSVGMPIEVATYTLCKKMPDSLIAKEFMYSLNKMQLGLSGWQDALVELAETYNIKILTEFVQNITTSYAKGVSIAESVSKRNKDIKEEHMLTVEERASKATNSILVPMMVFQVIPIILFILLPAISEIGSGLTF